MPEPFVPPPYPYDRLDRLRPLADGVGDVIDLSIGTPFDPPPAEVIAAFGSSGAERGYPPSIGTAGLRDAASQWMGRRFGIEVVSAHIATCIGTKEFVGTLPQWMRLRAPERDVVLYPAVSYPTYAMGA
ncbi:MAG: aminotransferase class I/II-fold pyridoxal phosphate-dependent enzyme, partial [Ilumatobacteraceae bacterium]